MNSSEGEKTSMEVQFVAVCNNYLYFGPAMVWAACGAMDISIKEEGCLGTSDKSFINICLIIYFRTIDL